MNSHIKQLAHRVQAPLNIERDISMGHEIIIIEGVRYDADYFRMFAHPDTDVLYAVKKDAEGIVCLTIIRTAEEAKEFFDPTPLPSASPQMGERHLEGEEQDQENKYVL